LLLDCIDDAVIEDSLLPGSALLSDFFVPLCSELACSGFAVGAFAVPILAALSELAFDESSSFESSPSFEDESLGASSVAADSSSSCRGARVSCDVAQAHTMHAQT
jgi:hypothetical protein